MREYIGKTEIESMGSWQSHRSGLPLIRRTYDSMMDFCADAKTGLDAYMEMHGYSGFSNSFAYNFSGVRSWQEMEQLCIEGWNEKLPQTLEIAEAAVRLVEVEMEQFEPQHQVYGADVDVAAAVAGLPEDMIDYPLTMVSNVGTTVTICTDVQCHAGVGTKAIIDRGIVIVALALALEQAGHQTELWVSDEYTAGSSRAILRTLVKSTSEYIDPARIMFAYAHPAVQRGLGFCTIAGMPAPWFHIARASYGNVSGITKDLPEGTIYMEPVFRYSDTPNAEAELRRYLIQLGLLADPDDEE
jgi:hypothetical protein